MDVNYKAVDIRELNYLHPSIDATMPKSFGGTTEPVDVVDAYSSTSRAPMIISVTIQLLAMKDHLPGVERATAKGRSACQLHMTVFVAASGNGNSCLR